jgi:hypothetical protein
MSFPGNAGSGCRHFFSAMSGKIGWQGLETQAGGEHII